MHVFKYSRRKGTVADRMENQIDEKLKTQRSAKLLSLEKEMSAEYRKSLIGSRQSVLFEEIEVHNGKSYAAGYTTNYVRVLVPCGDNTENIINTVAEVVCEEITDDTMYIIGKVD